MNAAERQATRQVKWEQTDQGRAEMNPAAFIKLLALRLKGLWQSRWPYPHASFTSKGPGLKHDPFGANWKPQSIHKSIPKHANREYTQNKTEIAWREFCNPQLTEHERAALIALFSPDQAR